MKLCHIFLLLVVFAKTSIAEDLTFSLDPQNFVRHWLFTGSILSDYQGKETKTDAVFKDSIKTPAPFSPLTPASAFNPTLPNGSKLLPYAMGEKIFFDASQFHRKMAVQEGFALTEIWLETPAQVKIRLWAGRGSAELWCNEKSIKKTFNYKSQPNVTDLTLNLRAGQNRLFIRRVNTAERNQVFETGLQIVEPPQSLKVRLPGDQVALKKFYDGERWLRELKGSDAQEIITESLPPGEVTIIGSNIHVLQKLIDRKPVIWPSSKKIVVLAELFAAPIPLSIQINLKIADAVLSRNMQWSSLVPLPKEKESEAKAHQQSLMKTAFERRNIPSDVPYRFWTLFKGFQISMLLLSPAEADRKAIPSLYEMMIKTIKNHDGTSDFQLAAAMRLLKTSSKNLTQEQLANIKNAALDFRYSETEPGVDSLSFSSENHKILMHSSNRIAGLLYPEDIFIRSQKVGKEQAQVAKERLLKWMDEREQWGFEEYLSPSYIGETFLGLLNVYDYAEDTELRKRAGKLMDQILVMSAEHTLHGFALGCSARLYRRDLLVPQAEAKQAILSWAVPGVVTGCHPVFVALGSTSYEAPTDLMQKLNAPVEKTFAQGGTELYLKKTEDYMISSARLPSPLPPQNPWASLYQPGGFMYQNHLWEVSLGETARIFVQHPATSDELLDARPGYWVGEGTSPTLRAEAGAIYEIFNIAADCPVQFTHAWWPQGSFDEQKLESHWAFARKGNAYVALWCSQPLAPYENVSVRSELRAYGSEAAWFCKASSKKESGSFEQFQTAMKELKPAYQTDSKSLTLKGKEMLRWQKGS